MRVVVVNPLERPYIANVDNTLESLQEAVGGYIEVVPIYTDTVTIVCNENGKIENLTPNRAIRDKNGDIMDVLCGTFLVCGMGEEDFCDLTAEQAEKYCNEFLNPEAFMKIGNRIMSIPV